MRLSFDQIKEITVGSLLTEERDGSVHFNKCTPKQVEAWYAKSEVLGQRSLCTTGVRLDFHTNSQNLSFRATSGKKYEAHVDGLIHHVFRPCVPETVSCKLCGHLGETQEEYRVTLVLPSHEVGALEFIELDDGAYVRPHEFDRKMLFIGDSITQGWESSLDSYSYAYRVSAFYNANSVIQGIGGAYYNEDSFDTLDFDPDTVFVAYGTNDFGHYKTYDDLKAHCKAHLSLIADAYRGKRIFVISPIWRDKREGKAMGIH